MGADPDTAIAGDGPPPVAADLAVAIESARRARPAEPLEHGTLARWRATIVPGPLLPPPAPQPVTRLVPGPKDAPDVQVMIIDPAPGTTGKPALLDMHGGGFVLGSATTRRAALQEIAARCACLVVSVNYRLAPEAAFPRPLEDNYAALCWTYTHAEELGIDPRRIAVGGGSAGGGHAAMLAIAARDRGEVPIAFQLLVQPMLDDRTGITRSMPPTVGAHIWTAEMNRFGWGALLGKPAGAASVPPGSVPARVDDLRGLPPTWIGVGALDLFVFENLEYAARLAGAGVPVEAHVVPGAPHGFHHLAPEAPVARRYVESYLGALARAFDGQPCAGEAHPVRHSFPIPSHGK